MSDGRLRRKTLAESAGMVLLVWAMGLQTAHSDEFQMIPVDFYPGPAKAVLRGATLPTTTTPGTIRFPKSTSELSAVKHVYEIRFAVDDYTSPPVFVLPYSTWTPRETVRRTGCAMCCLGPVLGGLSLLQQARSGAIWELRPDAIYAINKAAAESLGRVEPVIRGLGSKVEWVRADAAEVLGNIGDSSVVGFLTTALEDSSSMVRREAVKALAKIGQTESVERMLLRVMQNDDASEVRRTAIEALGKSNSSGPEIVEALTAVLERDPAGEVRKAAVEALSAIRNTAITNTLLHAFHDSDVDVRFAAARAVGRQGTGVVASLTDALKDPDGVVRCCAAVALANIGPDAVSAVPRLVESFPNTELVHRWSYVAAFMTGRPADTLYARQLLADWPLAALYRAFSGSVESLRTVPIPAYYVPDTLLRQQIDHLESLFGGSGAFERGALRVRSAQREFDVMGHPAYTYVTNDCELPYTLHAGSQALARITGRTLGSDKSVWVQWWQEHQGEFSR